MSQNIPLAERMRPQTLDELVGQQHLTGKGSILRSSITQGNLPSIILWGPPGVGKTTIAHIIAQAINAPYFQLSAISSGVKEVREVIEQARHTSKAILFIDEIHRFNKGQQDALLGAVEKGIITLIGATTENPSFEVNSALLSRAQVYVLRPLQETDLVALLHQALIKDEWLKQYKIVLKETAAMVKISGGDARKLLNLLELVSQTIISTGDLAITDDRVMNIAQQKIALYDKKGEQHYDIISAFIKSMRGSDPNGAVYWLARMIEGGEDIKFIARRMLIFSSEDIGNANPNALLLANATFDAVSKIGYPESRIILSQCATYLASSAKSNAAYEAIGKALRAVQQTGDLPVPLHIRNAPTKLMKDMEYGKNYQYSHLGEGNFIEQEYLPQPLAGTPFYQPGNNARENELRKFLKDRWKGKYGY
ncbi:replication-associated recombination protein A [Parasediminibacterium sp. JCM 36343]|uniref:replication-associated recombination protein A n=1 Tax=Parasediminibacterium sp. JCM 36343 TaxID=3374279 RepID=UPI00397A68A3